MFKFPHRWAENTPKDRILHQKPTQLAKQSPFFFFSPMRPLSTGKLHTLKLRKLNDSCTYLSGNKNASAMQGPHVPLREIYIFQLYPLQVKYLENQNNIFDKYQRIHVWCIYLHLVYVVNLWKKCGVNIPVPWSIWELGI